MVVVSHPPCSPKLAHCYFFFVPRDESGFERECLPMQRINDNRWRPLTAFPLKILDIVSSSGSSTGITVSSHRGSTLEGTKVSNLYEYLNKFFLTVTEIFGSPSYSWNVEYFSSFLKENSTKMIR